MFSPRVEGAGLSGRQVMILSAYGLVLWFLAALAIRYGTPAGLFGRSANIVAYAVTAPGSFLLASSSARWAQLRPGQILAGVTVASVAGLGGDGVAIAWLPRLYGDDATAALPGIAWLSFGVAASLVWAFWLDRKASL
jgi:hypothetical protein